ncbi:MAG: hypothetical protein C0478_13900 [Planctomyces sp.]|jgi:lipoprotein NlpI|nr:hypothetical protein [Planctomyces sp.]
MVALTDESSSLQAAEDPADMAFLKLHEKPRKRYEGITQELTARVKDTPNSASLWLRLGDARFFAGDAAGALAAYDECVKLSPERLTAFWQRGLVLHAVGQWKEGAAQFQMYHDQISQSDRENGLWQILCNAPLLGEDKALEQRIRYVKPDRQPFPLVYRMYEKEVSLDQVRKQLAATQLSKAEQDSVDFYLPLYAGFQSHMRGQTAEARQLYDEALKSTWAPEAGYGPNFMWHVGRLQRASLTPK